jgi:hypothetical protein
MKLYFKTIFVHVVPFIIMLGAAYLLGSFINVSWNPIDWTSEARLITSIWGIGFGFALAIRLRMEGVI